MDHFRFQRVFFFFSYLARIWSLLRERAHHKPTVSLSPQFTFFNVYTANNGLRLKRSIDLYANCTYGALHTITFHFICCCWFSIVRRASTDERIPMQSWQPIQRHRWWRGMEMVLFRLFMERPHPWNSTVYYLPLGRVMPPTALFCAYNFRDENWSETWCQWRGIFVFCIF